jgi:hypothetical protein
MYQSGRIAGRCSTALSAAATLGIVTLSIAAPCVGFPGGAMSGSVAVKSTIATGSEQVTTETGQSAKTLAQLRAFAATIAGPELASGSPAPTPQVSPPAVASVDQPGEPVTPPPQWSQTEVAAALMECVNLLAPINAQVVPLAPLRYNDCGTPAPVLLRGIGAKDRVAVDPPMLMNCPMVVALSRWLDKIVQPAARATLGSPVTRIVGSSYSCRNLYNLPNERRSQHAFANAIDLPMFFLADGRRVDLATGWGPTRRDLAAGTKLVPIISKTAAADDQTGSVIPVKATASGTAVEAKASGETAPAAPSDADTNAKPPAPDPLSLPQAKFLRQVHDGACEVFTTVLGPEANDVHRTHLHLDLQERHSLNVCE